MLTNIAVAVVFLILGYVLRKYVEKKYPAEAARLDDKAKYYGEQAQDRLDEARAKVDEAREKMSK